MSTLVGCRDLEGSYCVGHCASESRSTSSMATVSKGNETSNGGCREGKCQDTRGPGPPKGRHPELKVLQYI